MDADIKANRWGIKKITEVEDAQELMKIFSDFYTMTGRLPLSNSLLVAPDGDAPPDEKVNMRQLYDLYKNAKSHGIVSPFLRTSSVLSRRKRPISDKKCNIRTIL